MCIQYLHYIHPPYKCLYKFHYDLFIHTYIQCTSIIFSPPLFPLPPPSGSLPQTVFPLRSCPFPSLAVLWSWTQGFVLARQELCYLSHVSAPFGLVIFWVGSCFFALAILDYYLPVYSCHVAEMTAVCHHAQLIA
jgi:hypothetical protein